MRLRFFHYCLISYTEPVCKYFVDHLVETNDNESVADIRDEAPFLLKRGPGAVFR